MLRLRALNNTAHQAWKPEQEKVTAKKIERILRKVIKEHGLTPVKITVNKGVTFISATSETSSYEPKNVYSVCDAFDYESHRQLSPEGNRPKALKCWRLFNVPLSILGTSIKPTQTKVTAPPKAEPKPEPKRQTKTKSKQHDQTDYEFPFTPL